MGLKRIDQIKYQTCFILYLIIILSGSYPALIGHLLILVTQDVTYGGDIFSTSGGKHLLDQISKALANYN